MSKLLVADKKDRCYHPYSLNCCNSGAICGTVRQCITNECLDREAISLIYVALAQCFSAERADAVLSIESWIQYPSSVDHQPTIELIVQVYGNMVTLTTTIHLTTNTFRSLMHYILPSNVPNL